MDDVWLSEQEGAAEGRIELEGGALVWSASALALGDASLGATALQMSRSVGERPQGFFQRLLRRPKRPEHRLHLELRGGAQRLRLMAAASDALPDSIPELVQDGARVPLPALMGVAKAARKLGADWVRADVLGAERVPIPEPRPEPRPAPPRPAAPPPTPEEEEVQAAPTPPPPPRPEPRDAGPPQRQPIAGPDAPEFVFPRPTLPEIEDEASAWARLEALEEQVWTTEDVALRIALCLEKAKLHLALEQEEEALEMARMVLDLEPEDVEAQDLALGLAAKREEWDALTMLLSQRASVSVDVGLAVSTLMMLAYVKEMQLADPYEAQVAYQRALELEPAHRSALLGLRRLLWDTEDWSQLVDTLRVMAEALPSSEERVLCTVEAADVMNGALEYPDRALELLGSGPPEVWSHPRAVELLKVFGVEPPTFETKTSVAQQIEALQRAFKENPADPLPLRHARYLYDAQGRVEMVRMLLGLEERSMQGRAARERVRVVLKRAFFQSLFLEEDESEVLSEVYALEPRLRAVLDGDDVQSLIARLAGEGAVDIEAHRAEAQRFYGEDVFASGRRVSMAMVELAVELVMAAMA